MREHDRFLNRPHRRALLRELDAGSIDIRSMANELDLSERAVYRIAEGEVPGRWWLPRVAFRVSRSVETFAALSGADELGIVCVALEPGNVTGDDLARVALQLGGRAGAVQELVSAATAPLSPGGTKIVSEEITAIKDAIRSLKAAAQTLEESLHQLEPPVVGDER